ncbi:hypothetical protein T12_11399 [Trichinella patagoniensis]|uniref:Uncharacterized protein n=1 Tax=Trichinella patagoniensis TaxID=990121 RepID=A0A0V0XLN4_9BILA|nr:hypothetical protein T12_11399 [Trichinella patagoniensis]
MKRETSKAIAFAVFAIFESRLLTQISLSLLYMAKL